jgi:hypothetical protein
VPSTPAPVGQAISATAWLSGPECVRTSGVALCAGKRIAGAGALETVRGLSVPIVAATALIASSDLTSPNTCTSIGPVASSGCQKVLNAAGVSAVTVSLAGKPQRGSLSWRKYSRSRLSTPDGEESRLL